MSTPLATATLTLIISPVQFPLGTTLGSIVASMTGSASGNTTPVTQTVAAGTASITFPNLPADTYAISIQQQNGAGAALGAALTGSITLTEPQTVTLGVPTSFTAAQTA